VILHVVNSTTVRRRAMQHVPRRVQTTRRCATWGYVAFSAPSCGAIFVSSTIAAYELPPDVYARRLVMGELTDDGAWSNIPAGAVVCVYFHNYQGGVDIPDVVG